MRRDAVAFLCIFLYAFAARACAGETRITGVVEGIVDDSPVDEAALERERARIRAELAALSRRVADGYIAEQPAGEKRDQITLIVGALYETGRLGGGGRRHRRAVLRTRRRVRLAGGFGGACGSVHGRGGDAFRNCPPRSRACASAV